MGHRYTEARIYLVGISVALLLMLWTALAAQDHARSRVTQTDAQTSISQDAGGYSRFVVPQVRPQTRTRGS